MDYPSMLHRKLVFVGVVAAFVFAAACGKTESKSSNKGKSGPVTKPPVGKPKPKPKAKPKRNAAWDKFVRRYILASMKANPHRGVSAGRHELDGLVPDLSRAGLKKEEARLRKALADAKAFDASTLNAKQVFERKYMIARLEGDLFQFDSKAFERVPFLYAWPINPTNYIQRDYAPLATRMKAVVKLQNNIPSVLAAARANLHTPMPKTYLAVSLGIFKGYASFFKAAVPKVFASVKGDDLHKQFDAANKKTVAAFDDFVKWLKAQLPEAKNNFALGPKLYREMLVKTEMVTTPVAELEKIGEADLERNTATLKAECKRIAPGKPIKTCVHIVQADKPKEGPVERAKKQLAELEAFLRKVDIVTIPGTERATVHEAPPYNRFNFAYINIPGLWEKKQVKAVYYIAPPDPKWTKKEREEYIPGEWDLLFVSVHEVWPGHFLNYLHAKRAASMFGRLFVGYAFSEGWAHYTEEMMWNVGLHKGNAKAHVGQLLNALLRNVRFLASIGMHTEGMTVEAAEKMFLDKAYQDAGNARQQAYRGTMDPGYLNYTMGKLMIRKLRDDWCKSRGGRKCWKKFHDTFLSFGGPPIPLVRKEMLGAADDGKLF